MATCCNVMSKVLIVLVNFLTWVLAAGFIFISIWILREFGIYGKLFDANVLSLLPASVVLAIGLALFLLGLVGCVGVVKEQKCIIGLYFSLLLVLFVGLGAGAGLSYMYRQKLDNGVHTLMKDAFEKYGDGGNSSVDAVIDEMQSDMHCCGVDNYTDWINMSWHKSHPHMQYPTSCCRNNSCDSSGEQVNSTSPDVYTQGCYTMLKDELVGHVVALYSIIGAAAVILFIGMASACMLLRDRRNRDFIYRDLGNDDGMHV